MDPERFALPRGDVGGGLRVGLGLRRVFGVGGRGGEGLLDCHDTARGRRLVELQVVCVCVCARILYWIGKIEINSVVEAKSCTY